jgi:hypothetical protein
MAIAKHPLYMVFMLFLFVILWIGSGFESAKEVIIIVKKLKAEEEKEKSQKMNDEDIAH